MSRCAPDCIPKGAAALGRQIRSSISLKIGLERNNFSLIKQVYVRIEVFNMSNMR
jgi:hypothetical protein